VIGVSPDPVSKHARFKARRKLTYPLVADTDHAIAASYGVWAEKSFFGRKYWGVERTTFVIDAEGRVARVFAKVNPIGHAAEVADVVAALR
jgi:peroxiredoxin Q/BCP